MRFHAPRPSKNLKLSTAHFFLGGVSTHNSEISLLAGLFQAVRLKAKCLAIVAVVAGWGVSSVVAAVRGTSMEEDFASRIQPLLAET
ncbi:MAG TPA: hypothetical protein PLN52_18140, partial [Opitutaceae bacterium]|nr:hypothetical protein [Opitutaceae bacterium]